MNIRVYNNMTDRKAVLDIYRISFTADSPHNDPEASLDRKLSRKDDLLIVAESDDGKIFGTVMIGYDGHRGWIYSLAVNPEYRNMGIGSALLGFAEKRLKTLGCPKINLQVLASNSETISFYQKNGYKVEERISMGKKLY